MFLGAKLTILTISQTFIPLFVIKNASGILFCRDLCIFYFLFVNKNAFIPFKL